MDLCVSHIGELQTHNEETGETEYTRPQNSPFLYKADGSRIMRLPTNVNTVPGGTTFEGDQMLSGDYSHYVLSTTTPFVPGGPTTEPGAVYDNDINGKTDPDRVPDARRRNPVADARRKADRDRRSVVRWLAHPDGGHDLEILHGLRIR